MEQHFDNLSRRLAATTSRREAVRVFCSALGGIVTSACAGNPLKPDVEDPACSGCVGSDRKCYTCEDPYYCTSNPPANGICSRPSSGGVSCCHTCSGCLGSNNVCYTCAAGNFCTRNANGASNCSAPNAAGVSCCTSSTGGGGGNSTRYYVSANGCDGGSAVSYSGYDYTVCNIHYRSAVALRCTKIYDNCR